MISITPSLHASSIARTQISKQYGRGVSSLVREGQCGSYRLRAGERNSSIATLRHQTSNGGSRRHGMASACPSHRRKGSASQWLWSPRCHLLRGLAPVVVRAAAFTTFCSSRKGPARSHQDCQIAPVSLASRTSRSRLPMSTKLILRIDLLARFPFLY